jgi:acyl-CoA thioesterase I
MRHLINGPLSPRASIFYTISVDVRRSVLVSFLFLLASASMMIRPVAAATHTLICFGDSITAGHGLEQGQSYPDYLEHDLTAAGYHYRVLNRGTSGATTGDAVANLPGIVALHPEVVVVEFGGNDGLRGLPLDITRRNLDQVLTALQAAQIKILLAGITLPPNYGQDYIQSFQQVFQTLATRHHVAFVPMIYKNLIHVPGTIQDDGIHPTAKGSAILASTLMPALKPLLAK